MFESLLTLQKLSKEIIWLQALVKNTHLFKCSEGITILFYVVKK